MGSPLASSIFSVWLFVYSEALPAARPGCLREVFGLVLGPAQVGVQRMEVFSDIAAEVRRVIRVHRHLHATLDHVEDVVLGHVVEHSVWC